MFSTSHQVRTQWGNLNRERVWGVFEVSFFKYLIAPFWREKTEGIGETIEGKAQKR